MKINLSLLIILLGISSIKVYSQCSSTATTFQKAYGGSGNERAHSIQKTSDGGYVVAGETTSYGAGDKDIFVLKIDVNGIEQWTKTYGSTFADDGFSITIKQTNDSGFVISGSTNGFGAGSYDDSYIIKINNTGIIQWERRISGSSWDRFRDVVELSTGDFLLTGDDGSYSAGNLDAHVVKISSTGNLIWIKNLGTSFREHSQSIIELPNGNYLLSGNTCDNSSSNAAYPFIIKTTNSGTVIWGKEYNISTFFTDINETILLNDGNLLNVGETRTSDLANHDIFLLKTDTNGTVIWSKKYGGIGNDIGVNVREKTNGELVISAFTGSYGNANQLLLINTDVSGNVIWSKTYGGSGNDELDWWGKPMELLTTNEIIIAGGTLSFGAGNEDVYVVKTNECGESYCNEQTVTLTTSSLSPTSSSFNVLTTSGGALSNTNSIVNTISFTENVLCDSNLVSVNILSDLNTSLNVYPNPAFNLLNVKMDKEFEIQHVELYSITGQKVNTKSIEKTDGFIQIDISNLSEGLYFLKVYDKDKITGTSKFFKM